MIQKSLGRGPSQAPCVMIEAKISDDVARELVIVVMLGDLKVRRI